MVILEIEVWIYLLSKLITLLGEVREPIMLCEFGNMPSSKGNLFLDSYKQKHSNILLILHSQSYDFLTSFYIYYRTFVFIYLILQKSVETMIIEGKPKTFQLAYHVFLQVKW